MSEKEIKVDSTAQFIQQTSALFSSSEYSDIEFIVQSQKIPAHRVILAPRCTYFAAMLYGSFAESTQREIKLDVPLDAFKTILQYIYIGTISISEINEVHIFETLQLADEYGLEALAAGIMAHLIESISLEKCCTTLNTALLHNWEALASGCMTFLDCHAASILAHPVLKDLSKSSLCTVLQRDTFCVDEIDILHAVQAWHQSNEAVELKSVLSHVRLSQMTTEQIVTTVRSLGIFEPDELLDALAQKKGSNDVLPRALLRPDENMASALYNSKTISGLCPEALLDGQTKNYTGNTGYTYHNIPDPTDNGIIVELGSVCFINHIKMLLWDLDDRSYSYYIEVSVNKKQWVRVIDHSHQDCRSWQYLTFPKRAIRFIKLVGTHNTANGQFHVVALEAKYAESPENCRGEEKAN